MAVNCSDLFDLGLGEGVVGMLRADRRDDDGEGDEGVKKGLHGH
jgi:hypothetical protein